MTSPAAAMRRFGFSLLVVAAVAVPADVSRGGDIGVPAGGSATAATETATAGDASDTLAKLLPPRTDTPTDWHAPLEPLHDCGEPRVLPPCIPPPPCHPSLPPQPFDLVGARGCPTCGPIYRGPCAPRTGTHDVGPLPRLHRVHDRLFDWFYAPHTHFSP